MTKLKTIHEFHYCFTEEREQDFNGYIWPTIKRNYKLYCPVDSPDVFQQHPVLYELKNNNSCLRLRRNEYLIRVANAIVNFGERSIVSDLNKFCRDKVDDLPPILSDSYRVPDFIKWSDVTDYVGNRDSFALPDWFRDKKQLVFNHISVVAERHGIDNHHWSILVDLYQQRNTNCHGNLNEADAESMRQFATENVQDRNEQEAIEVLHRCVLPLLPLMRRGQP